jgi:ribonuclease HI
MASDVVRFSHRISISPSANQDAGMSKPLTLTIHIDGAARGNPGPAAFAYVIYHEGEPLLDGNGVLGKTTNNVAEYTALIEALKKAAELKATAVRIRSDSELLVRQMKGEYRVKNANLVPLHQEAGRLARQFESVSYEYVPREENREADRLCNEALDGSAKGTAPARRSRPHAAAATSLDRQSILAEAEKLLRDAARAWAETGLENPTPHQVFQQIIRHLERNGLLSTK